MLPATKDDTSKVLICFCTPKLITVFKWYHGGNEAFALDHQYTCYFSCQIWKSSEVSEKNLNRGERSTHSTVWHHVLHRKWKHVKNISVQLYMSIFYRFIYIYIYYVFQKKYTEHILGNMWLMECAWAQGNALKFCWFNTIILVMSKQHTCKRRFHPENFCVFWTDQIFMVRLYCWWTLWSYQTFLVA